MTFTAAQKSSILIWVLTKTPSEFLYKRSIAPETLYKTVKTTHLTSKPFSAHNLDIGDGHDTNMFVDDIKCGV